MTKPHRSGSRVSGEAGIVLHTRAYRETSVIVSIFTLHHGRIAAVAKGARGGRRTNALQPFNTLSLSWTGRGAMVTLTGYESRTHPLLKGDAMAAAFYVVELVTRLVGEHESLPRIYAALEWSIESLSGGRPPMETVLRSFEKLLMAELGYGLDFAHDASTGLPVRADDGYRLDLERGFVSGPGSDAGAPESETYSGQVLLDIAADRYESVATRRAAKRIFRLALTAHLGPKPLTSRRLLFRGQR
ncbi:MAG: DNA repair protein RecO [Gammaproteobacteria bacterium]|nr:DNA repair protein RecO [Gammaproteobacteria bacterium]